jgi:4-amino-4-deoxy-L-arabinose transferase-like glycosyltransferase
MTETQGRWRWTTVARLAPWLLVGGLVLFHAANNWIWLTDNVTWTGWDELRHLAWSLNYAHLLSRFSIHSLFEVAVSDPIRPPFFSASAAIMYGLFGRTADVATMVNVIYMAVVLAATYGVGRRWGGRRLGLVSVALLAFFPMFYAMSRYFYMEFALAALATLTVYLLLATDGFRRRGLSLLFGLSLGLGLLTTRTFVVYVAGPLVVALLSSRVVSLAWQRLKQRPRLYWTRLILALLGGLAVAALWYLPNRETVRALTLGDALFFVWWILASLAIYSLMLASHPLSNVLAAGFLAAGLASTWYLARIEFVQRVGLYGFGINDPRGRMTSLGSLDTYLYYVRKLANEHLSLVTFVVLVALLIVAVLVVLFRQKSVKRALQHVRPEGWMVLTWIGGAYAVFTLSIYHETRAFTPVLPAIALLMAAAFSKLPWRRVRLGLLALVLAFSLVQFFVLSYEPVNRLLPPRTFNLPIWGQTSLFARGADIQLPDEGPTDRGYWIQPDVLARMEQRRQALGRETLSLGLLVNTSQINFGSFNYLILTEYPDLRVATPISGVAPSRFLFSHDYVAVGRVSEGMDHSQADVVQAIGDDSSGLFAQAFAEETTYHLPDGDTVRLYRQRYPLPTGYPVEYVTHLAEQLDDQTRAGDAILLTPRELGGAFISTYGGPATVYLVPDTVDELAAIAAQHRRVFLVLGDSQAGEVQTFAQEWLNRCGFWASHEWADSLQVLTYGTTETPPAATPAVQSHALLGGQIELLGFDLPPADWHPGEIVPLTLFWQRRTSVKEEYGVFVHLVNASGHLVAQTDSPPVGGFRPTTEWRSEEIVVDRHGLPLPTALPPGKYELRVGMVSPTSGERLPLVGADGQATGDSISLGSLAVASP